MIELIIGSIIAVGVVIFVEYQRQPKLKIEIAPPIDFDNTKLRSLRFRVSNLPLPTILKWINRQPALQCHGYIAFHDSVNGHNFFGRAMQIRWVNNPEPTPLEIIFEDRTKAKIYDPIRFTQLQRMDIYPGEYEDLDVVVRHKEDRKCYGWNDESYRYNGKNPHWQLDKDQYLILLTIKTSGKILPEQFRLINPMLIDDFRIVDCTKEDPRLI